MSENAWKSIRTTLAVLFIGAMLLTFASRLGWIVAEYRGVLGDIALVLLLAVLGVTYVVEKEARRQYRAYALWAVAISIPFLTLTFLRDYWLNNWFQSTLFPSAILPVMIATLLGYVVVAFFAFRSKRQAG